MGKLATVREVWSFARHSKKWWLAPVIVALLLLGILLIFASTSVLAPFIYTLF